MLVWWFTCKFSSSLSISDTEEQINIMYHLFGLNYIWLYKLKFTLCIIPPPPLQYVDWNNCHCQCPFLKILISKFITISHYKNTVNVWCSTHKIQSYKIYIYKTKDTSDTIHLTKRSVNFPNNIYVIWPACTISGLE